MNQDLEQRLKTIEDRNTRVEKDKCPEKSEHFTSVIKSGWV